MEFCSTSRGSRRRRTVRVRRPWTCHYFSPNALYAVAGISRDEIGLGPSSLDQLWRSPTFPMWLTLAAAGFFAVVLLLTLARAEKSVANGALTVITLLAVGVAVAAIVRRFGPARPRGRCVMRASPPISVALPALSCVDDLAGETVEAACEKALFGSAEIGRCGGLLCRRPREPPRRLRQCRRSEQDHDPGTGSAATVDPARSLRPHRLCAGRARPLQAVGLSGVSRDDRPGPDCRQHGGPYLRRAGCALCALMERPWHDGRCGPTAGSGHDRRNRGGPAASRAPPASRPMPIFRVRLRFRRSIS